jgi:hypothetical protein
MLGLELDLRLERVAHRIGNEVEHQDPGLPALTRDVDARLVHTPTALIEDTSSCPNGTRAVVIRHGRSVTELARRDTSKSAVCS